MEEKEIQKLMEGISAKNGEAMAKTIEEKIGNATKGLLTEAGLAESLEKAGLSSKSIKELTDAVEKQGTELNKMIAGQSANENKSIDQIFAEKKEELSIIGKGEKNKIVKFDIPQSVINKTNALRTSFASNALGMRLDVLGQAATRSFTMSSLFAQRPVSPNSGGVVRYADQLAITRAAAAVAEAGTFPESAITWQEFTMNVQKIGDQIPVSYEAFNDIDFISGEVNNLLNVNLRLKEDQDLYNGSGVSPIITGILTYAPTYTAPNLTLATPNLYDLILKVAESINSGRESKFKANIALVSYSDWNAMLITKTSTNYLRPEWASLTPDEANVSGITVIPTSLVAANTMLVGDFNWAEQYNMGGIEVEMGYIASQFIQDMFTIKARKRTALLVKNTSLNGFAKVTDIAAALVLLA